MALIRRDFRYLNYKQGTYGALYDLLVSFVACMSFVFFASFWSSAWCVLSLFFDDVWFCAVSFFFSFVRVFDCNGLQFDEKIGYQIKLWIRLLKNNTTFKKILIICRFYNAENYFQNEGNQTMADYTRRKTQRVNDKPKRNEDGSTQIISDWLEKLTVNFFLEMLKQTS